MTGVLLASFLFPVVFGICLTVTGNHTLVGGLAIDGNLGTLSPHCDLCKSEYISCSLKVRMVLFTTPCSPVVSWEMTKWLLFCV